MNTPYQNFLLHFRIKQTQILSRFKRILVCQLLFSIINKLLALSVAARIDILLAQWPLLPLRTVPILAPVGEVAAFHVPNVIIMEAVKWQLWLVEPPGAVAGVGVCHGADQPIQAFVDSRLNHEVGRERPHLVVHATAGAMKVHHVRPQHQIKRCELEGVHVDQE